MIPNQDYFALVGPPNSGKTALFNALTGSRQKVGNYPGVTVERKEGLVKISERQSFRLLDLPGIYGLAATTLDEAVTRDILISQHFEKKPPRFLVVVVDATNLERNLSLVLELQELQLPMLLVLNMMDLAKRRGFELNVEALSKSLKIPVVPVSATRRHGIDSLLEALAESEAKIVAGHFSAVEAATPKNSLTPKERLQARYRTIDSILATCRVRSIRPALWTSRLDRVVLHPLWGSLLLLSLLAAVFQAIFNFAAYPMGWIEQGLQWVTGLAAEGLPDAWWRSLLIDGVFAGVGAVVIFLPQILLLFFMIILLEDSGYMARAAFLMDRHMRRAGLHGRAFIPLLSSFACAIPGIMATRTIENRRDRLITILIAPLMACSARIPVYTLLIAAFIPNRGVWGPIRLQGLVMLGLYLLGVVFALLVAWVYKKLLFRQSDPVFLMELPTYKWPSLRNVCFGMWERARLFLRRAGTVILFASMAVWVLASYPKPPAGAEQNPIFYSYAGQIGRAVQPALAPLGFDWSISVGLLTGLVAREVIVGTLATIYSVQTADEGSMIQGLSDVIRSHWSFATGLSLLIYFVFAMQCLSTLAVARRETNSWLWSLWMFVYLNALAYGAAWVTYQFASRYG